jgi:hypothetical protein
MLRITLLSVVAVFSTTWAVAAPAPKFAPPDGLILVCPGDPAGRLRLYTPDGKLWNEPPVKGVGHAALSPARSKLAVFVRIDPPPQPRDDRPSWVTYDLYILPVEFSAKDKLGKPAAGGFRRPTAAWAPDGRTLYVSDLVERPNEAVMRPGSVTVCDLKTGTAATDAALDGLIVRAVSPDGNRLLASRFATVPPGGPGEKPTERWESVLLERETLNAVDVGAEEIEVTQFVGPDRLFGTRRVQPGRGEERVLFDLKRKSVSRVPLPAELVVLQAQVSDVRVSPDGKRVLYVWSEPAPPPSGRNNADVFSSRFGIPVFGGGASPQPPVCPGRLTTADADGENARTILEPTEQEWKGQFHQRFGDVEWR